MAYKFIEGSVTAAKGFKAAGVHCGIRKNKSKLLREAEEYYKRVIDNGVNYNHPDLLLENSQQRVV